MKLWPVLTSLHPAEGTKPSSAVPAVSLTAGYVAAAELPELPVPDWCLWDWCPLSAGSLVLLCPCQHSSPRCEAHPVAPSFCNEKVVLNSHVLKSGKTCVAPLPVPEGLSGGMSSHDVMIICVLSSKSPQTKYCASVSSSLCFLVDHLRGKGFARRYVFELGQWLAGASPVNFAVMICLSPCDLTLKPELNMPSRLQLLSWEAGCSPLLTQHLGPLAVSAPQGAQPRSAEVHT